MILETLSRILDVVDLLATAGIVAAAVFCFRRKQPSLTVAFFCFAMVSLLLTNAYWLAHSLIRPNMRMPMTANTIGECAVFLLLSAALNSVFTGSRLSLSPQVACAALFAAASVVFWLIWSEEWFQDILGGIVFGYFLCVCVHHVRRTGTLSRKEWIVLGVVSAVYMGLFAMSIYSGSSVYESAGYVLMFMTMLYFLGKAFRCIRRMESTDRQIVLSVAAYACCISGVYMSSGCWYIAAELLILLSLPMMLHAFGKEAKPA